MSKENIISEILDLEWRMMQQIEGLGRSEDEKPAFAAIRAAQFNAWPESLCECCLEDLKAAEAAGRNLQYEKFTRMLENIAPDEYAKALPLLPDPGDEIETLAAGIWATLRRLTEDFAQAYPVLGLSGRPLLAENETDVPSVETYQTAELLTYSVKTLRALSDFLAADTAAGNNMVLEIQKNTVAAMGFKSLEDAETQLTLEAFSQFEITGCSGCGMPAE